MKIILWHSCQGSPPRGRGKDKKDLRKGRQKRITPAWAGKRCARRNGGVCCRDHPRVGGEKVTVIVWLLCRAGSPPRGRRKVLAGCVPLLDKGITPAWAGKSICRKFGGTVF